MKKIIIRWIIITAVILLAPLAGEIFVEDWEWGVGGFAFAFVLIFATGMLFEWGRKVSANIYYRVGFGLALIAGFMIFWGNLAVGFIGEDNPANVAYLLMLMAAFVIAVASKFRARVMAWIMYSLAGIQLLIPLVAFNLWPSDFGPGIARIFIFSLCFSFLWILSGLLFRRSINES